MCERELKERGRVCMSECGRERVGASACCMKHLPISYQSICSTRSRSINMCAFHLLLLLLLLIGLSVCLFVLSNCLCFKCQDDRAVNWTFRSDLSRLNATEPTFQKNDISFELRRFPSLSSSPPPTWRKGARSTPRRGTTTNRFGAP